MSDNEALLEEAQTRLDEVARPYRQQINQQQRKADFIQQCIRLADRNDFFQLDEMLKTKIADDIEQDEGLDGCKEIFDRLRSYADHQIERYRIEFIEDLTTQAREVDLPLEIDFPRFTVLKGIEGVVDFSARKTVINKKTLKSVDPRRIVSAALKVKRDLYDRPFDPEAFIKGVYKTYADILKQEGKTVGDPAPIQSFYRDYVLSIQSKSFFQNMDKGRFRGYSADQMAVDFWRYYQSEAGASDGHLLQLSSGRGSALWLIDIDGEKRLITTIAFQERV